MIFFILIISIFIIMIIIIMYITSLNLPLHHPHIQEVLHQGARGGGGAADL